MLNCLLYGEDANRICPIEMKRSANVHELRKAIKDERSSSFGYRIDAVHLMLWAVSFPITRNVGDMIVGASFLDEEKLLPVELLSHIFPNQPPRDCIHVVIKCKWSCFIRLSLILTCPPSCNFTLTILSSCFGGLVCSRFMTTGK